jgi:hypothetical protein
VFVSTVGFFFYRDNFSTHYPIKAVSAEIYRTGSIPYWNFFDAGGQPLAGNPNTLTFYPDNVLYLFLPAHVAFNLHFLLHLAIAFFAMRALTRSAFGGALYALSGLAISATAFYNLIVAVAFIPLLLWGIERRSPWIVGSALGLLALAAEPVTLLGALLAALIVGAGRFPWKSALLALFLCAVIASPQLIAYAEIAGEVERTVPMSARTALNASLHPMRLVEIFLWPIHGFLNDAGDPFRARLFSTLLVGVIAVPALFRRSRYVIVAVALLFLALGRYNPLVAAVVDNVPLTRVARYPEKLAIPLIVALVVLSADYFRRSRFKLAWLPVTFIPLLWMTWRAVPIDWFTHYDVPHLSASRVHVESRVPAGAMDARSEYRLRARALEPLFGAVAGVRYAINPSPDGMHALRSRMVVERFHSASQKYARLHCNRPAWFVTRVIPARTIYEEASLVESPAFDETTTAVAAKSMAVTPGRVLRYRERLQSIEIDVASEGRSLLVVNQTYFRSWVARSGAKDLPTMAVDIDRLGVEVPPGNHDIVLRFGRFRAAIVAAWIASLLALLGSLFVEIRDRRTRQVDRPADEDRRDV